MPTVDFKGVDVHYTRSGRGQAVLLLHGFLESSSIWKPLGKAFTGRTTIAVDLLGHGQTGSLAYVHTMDEMADAAMTVIKNLGLRRADVVGHSMGGYVALALAERYPDAVRSLTLYQSSALADTPLKQADRQRAAALVKENHTAFIAHSIPALFAPEARTRHRRQVQALVKKAQHTTARGAAAALAGMAQRPDRSVILALAPFPVTVVYSEADPRIPTEESLALGTLNPRIKLISLGAVGHMGHIEAVGPSIAALKSAMR